MDGLKHVVDYGVIGLLVALSLWALAVAVERWLYYRRVTPTQFENIQLLEMALTKRLVVIGTVAANAPYIGLLGTVLGIMLTFHTMGTSGTMAVGTIMVGLSLALKATAIGLLVAIPCVVLNNILRRRVSELLTLYKVSMEREINQINVIPLVDVMLVLLVIVLTTATFISTGQVPVELAKATAVNDRKDVPLMITLTADGRLFLNDEPVPGDGLTAVLTRHPRESVVVLRADRVTVLERFVGVVDEVRGLGFRQVSLEVLRS